MNAFEPAIAAGRIDASLMEVNAALAQIRDVVGEAGWLSITSRFTPSSAAVDGWTILASPRCIVPRRILVLPSGAVTRSAGIF